MMPRLGAKYEIEIETISKPKEEYQTDEYFELDLPAAPAVMVGDEIVVEGSNVSQDKLEAAICRHLGLPEPEPQKKGILDLAVQIRGPKAERLSFMEPQKKRMGAVIKAAVLVLFPMLDSIGSHAAPQRETMAEPEIPCFNISDLMALSQVSPQPLFQMPPHMTKGL